jgi:acyl-CoA synthetase (AMP-forming)/AMP-acid ligase II
LPDDPHPDWFNTVGRPLPQTEIKIVNPETDETLPRGEIGEICARGYSIMKDYFDNPAGTAAAIDREGWLHTGDLARPSAAELEAFCRERLASYKVPRIWRFVDQFPQTASGKIQKFLLREQLSTG